MINLSSETNHSKLNIFAMIYCFDTDATHDFRYVSEIPAHPLELVCSVKASNFETLKFCQILTVLADCIRILKGLGTHSRALKQH